MAKRYVDFILSPFHPPRIRVFSTKLTTYQGYSPNLKDYGFRSHANAIAALARQNNLSSIILGGHDWGGATVYRVAQWYPQLVSAVFAIATPYNATSRTFTPTEDLVKGKLPNFGYQLQLGSEDGVMEEFIGKDEKLVRKFLEGMYGGRVEKGKKFMSPEKGVNLEVLGKGEVGKSPFFEEKVGYGLMLFVMVIVLL